MNITDIILDVGEALHPESATDLPLIRMVLNDAIDRAVRAGEMNEQQANNWSQDRAVKRVQRILAAK